MNPTDPHAAHDELLIARLFGDDLDATERSRAMDRIAECRECADLFAELGGIAAATSRLASPPRPREFTLSAADAARLQPERRVRLSILGAGLRRSLGGAVAIIGLAGIVVTGATSLIPSSEANLPAYYSFVADQAASQPSQELSDQLPNDAGSSVAEPVVAPGGSGMTGKTSGESADGASFEPSSRVPAPAPSGQGAARGGISLTVGDTAGSTGSDSRGQGIDPRLVFLAGFGLLFLLGLSVMIGPVIVARARSGRA